MKFPIFLLLGISSILNSYSQQRQPHILHSLSSTPTANVNNLPSTERFKSLKGKTRSGSIYLRYLDYLAAQEALSPADLALGHTLNFMFPDSNMRYNPPNQGYGITWGSIAQVLHPQSPIITSWLSPNDIIISNSDAYTIDSVWIGASYVKNTNAIDSVQFSLVHSGGNNLPEYYFFGQSANFGVDTVRFELPMYNPANFHHAYQSTAIGSPTAYVAQRALTNQDSSDYVPGSNQYSFKYIGFNANNFAVPAGEHVAVSFTFLPGFSWNSGDTISHNNRMLFSSYEPLGPNSFMPYYPTDRNMSSILYKDSIGWSGYYVPTVAFSLPFQPEIHDIFWKISCTTCANLSPTSSESDSRIKNIQFIPNPTEGIVNLSIDLGHPSSRLVFSVRNIQGQVLKKMDLSSSLRDSHLDKQIDLRDLQSGIYIYTIEADAEKYSDKIVLK